MASFPTRGVWRVGVGSGKIEDAVLGGYRNYLGPDGKVWRFPYSRIHLDPDIAETVLFMIYFEGVADQVDHDALVERVYEVIGQRWTAIGALVEDAKEGRLRQ
jgi:hypothetical protein